jgi:hypothetical protein
LTVLQTFAFGVAEVCHVIQITGVISFYIKPLPGNKVYPKFCLTKSHIWLWAAATLPSASEVGVIAK